ncbi:hypothetical protein MINS_10630 [Mycolicibacterium insubricum]|nr:hypothetical protein MINS_10630 [Mycolicibacterium insubricum]
MYSQQTDSKRIWCERDGARYSAAGVAGSLLSQRAADETAGTIYGMNKTTVYLPAALDLRLEAEAKAEGVSKAELIRRGITKLLDESDRPRRAKPLPVFRGVGDRTLDDRDRELTDEIAERAARR